VACPVSKESDPEGNALPTPWSRLTTPEEAAGAVYLFCIPESDYVSGQLLVCDGGGR